MVKQIGQLGCFLLLLALAGCQIPGPPPDPLFANHKPTETKAKAEAAINTRFFEPAPPVQRFFVDRR